MSKVFEYIGGTRNLIAILVVLGGSLISAVRAIDTANDAEVIAESNRIKIFELEKDVPLIKDNLDDVKAEQIIIKKSIEQLKQGQQQSRQWEIRAEEQSKRQTEILERLNRNLEKSN